MNDSLDSWGGYAYDVPSGPRAEARSNAAEIHLRRLLYARVLSQIGRQEVQGFRSTRVQTESEARIVVDDSLIEGKPCCSLIDGQSRTIASQRLALDEDIHHAPAGVEDIRQ